MSLPIPPGTYAIDTVHSQLGFAVNHLGISFVHGTFDRYSGAFYLGDALDDAVITIEAEMSSVNSGHTGRDQRLHGADFFDVAHHPEMTFRSTEVAEEGTCYAMQGDLTIKGITQPVTLTFAYNGSAVFPMDNCTHHGFTATGTISRSAFGVSYGVPLVSDEVALTLNVQFISPATDA